MRNTSEMTNQIGVIKPKTQPATTAQANIRRNTRITNLPYRTARKIKIACHYPVKW